MSSSSEFADSGRFSGGRPVRAPEKSNFAQTCNLLSRYLKEKGTFGDLNLGITRSFETNGTSNASTTMNLFPVTSTEKSGEILGVPTGNSGGGIMPGNLNPIGVFPQLVSFPPSTASSKEEQVMSKNTDSSVNKSEPETAQMTIFYGGQVIVFNNLTEDQAKEVFILAGKVGSQNPSSLVHKPIDSAANSTPSSPIVVPNFSTNVIPPTQPIVTALPIARKASLTRFLEKRKDRITARAPYQSSNSTATPFKPVESKSWLGLAAQSALQFQHQL